MSIKKGFKKAGNKFKKDVNSKSSQVFKEKGIGANFRSLGDRAQKGPLNEFAVGIKNTVVPPLKKTATDAFASMKDMSEKHDFKGKIDDIGKSIGLNKEGINKAFDTNLKDYGVEGVDASGLKSLGLDNIKNLKSNLKLDDFKQDPSTFLPAGGVNSIDPMEMAKEAGIGQVSNNGLNLKNVDVNKFLSGDISKLSIGGSKTDVLTQAGLSKNIDVSQFSDMLKSNKDALSEEFNNPVDFSSVSGNFNKDIFNKDAINTDMDFDNINMDSINFSESIDESNLLSEKNLSSVSLDADDYGGDNWLNSFDVRHGGFGDTNMDFNLDIPTDFLDADMDLQSMDLGNLPGGGSPIFDSTKKGLKDAFSDWDELDNVDGAFFSQVDMKENIEHSKDLSKKYTDAWGKDASAWSDTYAGLLNGEDVSFNSKFKVNSLASDFLDFDSKKWVIDLKNKVEGTINKLFGK